MVLLEKALKNASNGLMIIDFIKKEKMIIEIYIKKQRKKITLLFFNSLKILIKYYYFKTSYLN